MVALVGVVETTGIDFRAGWTKQQLSGCSLLGVVEIAGQDQPPGFAGARQGPPRPMPQGRCLRCSSKERVSGELRALVFVMRLEPAARERSTISTSDASVSERDRVTGIRQDGDSNRAAPHRAYGAPPHNKFGTGSKVRLEIRRCPRMLVIASSRGAMQRG